MNYDIVIENCKAIKQTAYFNLTKSPTHISKENVTKELNSVTETSKTITYKVTARNKLRMIFLDKEGVNGIWKEYSGSFESICGILLLKNELNANAAKTIMYSSVGWY